MKNKEFKPEIDTILRINIELLIQDTENSFIPKTIVATQLLDTYICKEMNEHVDDILNNRSFVLMDGLLIEADNAFVDIKKSLGEEND